MNKLDMSKDVKVIAVIFITNTDKVTLMYVQ